MKKLVLLLSLVLTQSLWANFYSTSKYANFSSSCGYGNGNDVSCHAELITSEKSVAKIVFVEDASCFNAKAENILGTEVVRDDEAEYMATKYYESSVNIEFYKQWTACLYDKQGKIVDIASVLVHGYSD